MPLSAGQPLPAEAPLFIVLNASSGRHDGETVRQTIERVLTQAGRTFTLLEAGKGSELAADGSRSAEPSGTWAGSRRTRRRGGEWRTVGGHTGRCSGERKVDGGCGSGEAASPGVGR